MRFVCIFSFLAPVISKFAYLYHTSERTLAFSFVMIEDLHDWVKLTPYFLTVILTNYGRKCMNFLYCDRCVFEILYFYLFSIFHLQLKASNVNLGKSK